MCASVRPRRVVVLLLALALAGAASAPAQQLPTRPPYKPEVEQPGKDVVWVPTPEPLVERMLEIAKVTPQDVVMDLGSGDGNIVIAAAKLGARAIGVEYNPDMVELSRANAEEAGVSDKATFVRGDLFNADLSQATVITLFLMPELNLKLRPKLLRLRPGTRIVSNSHTMDDWEADETSFVSVADGCYTWCSALLWIVPARVEGRWQTPAGVLTLAQTFQQVSGTLQTGGTKAAVTDGRLRGAELSLTIGGAQYVGEVNGNTIEGTVTSGGQTVPWKAVRVGA